MNKNKRRFRRKNVKMILRKKIRKKGKHPFDTTYGYIVSMRRKKRGA